MAGNKLKKTSYCLELACLNKIIRNFKRVYLFASESGNLPTGVLWLSGLFDLDSGGLGGLWNLQTGVLWLWRFHDQTSGGLGGLWYLHTGMPMGTL